MRHIRKIFGTDRLNNLNDYRKYMIVPETGVIDPKKGVTIHENKLHLHGYK